MKITLFEQAPYRHLPDDFEQYHEAVCSTPYSLTTRDGVYSSIRVNPARRRRAAPRVIKRKMPKWHVKRAHHAAWPQPQHPPEYQIRPAN